MAQGFTSNLPIPLSVARGGTGTTSSTGSGSTVLSNSPTLVTPTLGAASATSINFSGTTLNHYDEGTWTPVDNSGASLSFSNVSGVYTRIGRLVVCSGRADYPATASGANASIGGLPFTINATDAARSGCTLNYTNGATGRDILGTASSTHFEFYTAAGATVTNAQMTATANFFTLIYHI